MTQLLKVQNFMLSRDGFGSGEGQSLEQPFGHADPQVLSAWAGATASWPNRTDPGGTRGLDDYFTRDFANNIGAEIMGGSSSTPTSSTRSTSPWCRSTSAGASASGCRRRSSSTASTSTRCRARGAA